MSPQNDFPADPSGAARAPQTTNELVAEVKAALQRATPGPWYRQKEIVFAHGGELLALIGKADAQEANVQLVKNAPEWLGALVQAVEDQQNEVSRLRADGQRLRSYCHHRESCASRFIVPEPCTCGLDAP